MVASSALVSLCMRSLSALLLVCTGSMPEIAFLMIRIDLLAFDGYVGSKRVLPINVRRLLFGCACENECFAFLGRYSICKID
ncbi:unnamed protein product [Albugo candida]|uniref:Secreted protein n=1 Tax=Albugo candida TaxID=65357 RepID=A0A024GGF0_9STRA|nr:unnamed protein product [Albugo candida]|eukprot:CCI45844.1 unnamed protein product [Albugo candida]